MFEGKEGKPLDRELALARMRTHIGTVVGHYKGKIAQWDVVTEGKTSEYQVNMLVTFTLDD